MLCYFTHCQYTRTSTGKHSSLQQYLSKNFLFSFRKVQGPIPKHSKNINGLIRNTIRNKVGSLEMKDEGKGFIIKNGTRNQVPRPYRSAPCKKLEFCSNKRPLPQTLASCDKKPQRILPKRSRNWQKAEPRGGEMRVQGATCSSPLTHIRLPSPTHPHGFLFLYSALKKEGDGVTERPCHKDPSAFPAKQAVNQGPGEQLPLGLLVFSPLT